MKKFKIPFTGEVWNHVIYLVPENKWYSIQEIAKKWGDSPYIAEKYVNMAINSKVIITEGIGRKKKYKLNREDYKVKDMLKKLDRIKTKFLASKNQAKNSD